MKKIFFILTVFVTVFFFTGCEKENIKPTGTNTINTKEEPSFLFSKGHVYVWEAGYGYIHVGYYMREYRETGLMAWLLGPDCYGFSGNCLPEVVITSMAPNTDDEEESETLGMEYELSDATIDYVNSHYSIPLVSVLDSNWQSQYVFFANFANNCENIPSELLNDFSEGLLIIKQFPEGVYVVNQGATEYDDIPEYEW